MVAEPLVDPGAVGRRLGGGARARARGSMPSYSTMAVSMGLGRGKGTSSSGRSSARSEGWSGSEEVGPQEERAVGPEWHYVGDPESERWSSSEGQSWYAEDDQQSNENWSWGSGAWSSSRQSSENWEWTRPRDAWYEWHRDRAVLGSEVHVRGNDSGRRERSGVFHSLNGRVQGDPWGEYRRHGRGDRDGDVPSGRLDSQSQLRGESPTSPHGRDASGDLPSGDPSSAGQEKEKSAAGDRKGRISSSYPPIFRAKPGESYKEWKRAVDFWIGGEAASLPDELIGPRVMVQLRDRAGQLVHHLSNADVNQKNGLQIIFQTLEKSPIIRQLDRHKVDQHRKKL